MGAVSQDKQTDLGRLVTAASACLKQAEGDGSGLVAVRDELRTALERPSLKTADAIAGLRMLSELEAEVAAREALAEDMRLETVVRIHQGLGRLRETTSVEELIEAAPRELCETCGFSRAMLSRVNGSVWVPAVLHIVEGADPDGGDAFMDYVENAEIPLEHMLLETELVRRRIPALVHDPDQDRRTFKDIVDVSRSSSYVATPIMPTRRVIGFFHADRFGQERSVDATDRDHIWSFAEHFGLIYERAVLVERLEQQRTELRETLARAAAHIDALCETELDLTRFVPSEDAPARPVRQSTSRLATLLTPREREVLDLMASGATNTAIAARLVVSEGTVKTHVKRILRKLHVSNRAEAVARYLNVILRERAAG